MYKGHRVWFSQTETINWAQRWSKQQLMFVSTISPEHSKPLQLSSLLDLFQIYQWTASESVHCFLKIAPKMQAVPDTDTTVEEAERVLHLYRSTSFSAGYCRLHAAHRRDWNNPLCPLWVVLDFCNVPEKKDGGHLSELGFSAPKWWGTALQAH